MATQAQYHGTGKRKTSVARVILRPGDGGTWINGKTIEEYFPRLVHRVLATAPLQDGGLEGRYDLRVRVHGGGPTGQAGAVRHGSPVRSSRSIRSCASAQARSASSRVTPASVERKKAGLHKARKAPQFSKR